MPGSLSFEQIEVVSLPWSLIRHLYSVRASLLKPCGHHERERARRKPKRPKELHINTAYFFLSLEITISIRYQ